MTHGQIFNVCQECLSGLEIIRTNKGTGYFNIPCSLDIETSSFYEMVSGQPEKRAAMYCWMLGLNGAVILGRTWEEFHSCVKYLVDFLSLNTRNRLVIYVHNLSYEFQFICKRFEWEKVFSVDERKPVYALTTEGIEFRCSYLLSGYSLEKLGDTLTRYPIHKLVGNLDYSKIRHSETPLTEEEIAYCVNDVKVVMSYIQERIEADGDITKIPLTKTGYVRQYCRSECLPNYHARKTKEGSDRYYGYRRLIRSLTLVPDEYRTLKRAFQGGFTHASAWHSNKILEQVQSYDFTSSYPAVMVAEQFPMSKGEWIKIHSMKELRENLQLYCCVFDIEFTGLEGCTLIEHPLSYSRCWDVQEALVDNGRIISAGTLKTTITEQDFKIIERFYTWDKIRIGEFIRYRRGYLPTPFVRSILKLYKDKTELKGVKGSEIEYLRSKEMINSCYGMSVTDICRDENIYSDGWTTEPVDIKEALKKYNKAQNRFLFYPWGVWVTAYARANLFTGILAFGEDYVYSDTDSIKALNGPAHIGYINRYNRYISTKLNKALAWHGLPESFRTPKTIKGIEKPLGVWDDEGVYTKFKTLGAKRYLTLKDGELQLTVAGLNKGQAIEYMKEQAMGNIDKVFEAFSDGLYIPPEHTGKNTHTYLDEEHRGAIKDYTGMVSMYHEFSAVHMEGAEYNLSLAATYANYLKGIKDQYV